MRRGIAATSTTATAVKRGALVAQRPKMTPPYLDQLDRQRLEKQSKRNRGLPGWSNGPASEVRRLTGRELEARAQELGAVVSVPCKVSQRAGKSKPSNHKALAVPRLSHSANVGQPDPSRRRTAKVATAGQWPSRAADDRSALVFALSGP